MGGGSTTIATTSGLSRRLLLRAAAGAGAAAVAFPMLNFGRHQVFAASPKKYSTRAVDVVRRSLVIDMLAPLKIDFRPEASAGKISAKDAADFRASGITGFHNAIGIGGPNAKEESLAFIAAWSGYCGRNADLFIFF